MDIADPGLGLGLGLGGISDAVLSSNGTMEEGSSMPLAEIERDIIPAMDDIPVTADEDVIDGGSTRYETPVSFTTMTDLSKRSSLSVEERELLNFVIIRGFRPLSRTFFRALIPIQSTSCFIASLSETVRRGAVRRIVLARGSVPYGVNALGRVGVANG